MRVFLNTDRTDGGALAKTLDPLAQGTAKNLAVTVAVVHEGDEGMRAFWKDIQQKQGGTPRPIAHEGRTLEMVFFLNTPEAQEAIVRRMAPAVSPPGGEGPMAVLCCDEVPAPEVQPLWQKLIRDALARPS